MPAFLSKHSSILIIDDDINLIRMLSEILKDFGRILFANSGEMGLEVARQQKPSLILLDVAMTPMDGYEVCRRLRDDEVTRNIAIIFVTANTGMDSEIACLDAGAVDFICKPLNPLVVQARVRTHLRLIHDSASLELLAQRDALTGLYNRGYFDKAIDVEFKRLQRHQLPLGIALVDIDHFKNYNDTYGHIAGDIALRAVAEALQLATKRPGELVARYGGEEFVVLLPQVDASVLAQYGQLICDAVRALQIPHQASSCAAHITISVGLSIEIPHAESSPKDCIERADRALYHAKESGRNRYHIFSDS
ncbi:GGDEF domain-containing response regulator [Undibacterium flavidum]|uniref:diguanylate cyclase n=1 Tax=Undibacterium flavidum TaxID=2762297 RepID=A0ABR6YH26_9BURK|nr:diguanylate cyclase [Undibacterium flavidum]MBC3875812.1 diguanylate cyclase [Undibacterium flavidum]